MNPVGQPFVCSSPEVLRTIVEGLALAGVKASDVVVYERYRGNAENAGSKKWLPEGSDGMGLAGLFGLPAGHRGL